MPCSTPPLLTLTFPPAFTLCRFRQRLGRWPPRTFPTFKVLLRAGFPFNVVPLKHFLKNVHFSSQSSERSDPVPETPTASDLLSGSYDPVKLHPMASLWEQLDYLVLDIDKTKDLLVPGSGTANPHATRGHDYSCGLNPIGCLSPSGVITDIHHLIAFFRIF